MTSIVATTKASNLAGKEKNWAGFIVLKASITPAKSNSGFLERDGVPLFRAFLHYLKNLLGS
jgi:hypothetical protein